MQETSCTHAKESVQLAKYFAIPLETSNPHKVSNLISCTNYDK